jgi:hypothetical protein
MSYQSIGAIDPRYQLRSTGQCWDTIGLKSVPSIYCQSAPEEPGFFGKLWGGFKEVATVRGAGQQYPQQPLVSGGMPSWLLPVGLGVVAIGAVLLMTKKKSAPAAAPASNPARRRRSRR